MFRKYRRLALVLWKLGFINVLNFAQYKFKLKVGYIRFFTPERPSPVGEVFTESSVGHQFPASLAGHLTKSADQLRAGLHPFFTGNLKDVGSPPNWFQLGESGQDSHWSDVTINDQVSEDVKLTWDLSRFQWAPTLAAAYAITSEVKYLESLNHWLSNWSVLNPPNCGVNWVCAQEVSIRMLHLMNAAHLLGQDKNPSKALIEVVQVHCDRVAPTLQYSISQANNHGVTEAVALVVGGNWLTRFSESKAGKERAGQYARRGRQVLERLVANLVSADGSFSMYSLNYHRLVLDTLSLAEFWRIEMKLCPFSSVFLKNASLMVDYLYAFVDEKSGDVPNLGTNDGSRPFLITSSGYRDYRPTVQLAARLFQQSSKYFGVECDDALAWMRFTTEVARGEKLQRESVLFNESGSVVLIPGCDRKSWSSVRFPRYKYRPAHSDQLHFDLWYLGRNILCDSGTYSYNTDPTIENYFVGCEGHNTIQFDGLESMPKISRFLVAEWLKSKCVSNISEWTIGSRWQASYKDYRGVEHTRSISYQNSVWTITDRFQGFSESAVLRWHLAPLNWKVDGSAVCDGDIRITVTSKDEIKRFELLEGKRSLFYSVIEDNPVLEIEVGKNSTCIVTKFFLG
jgi:hypothetical protein